MKLVFISLISIGLYSVLSQGQTISIQDECAGYVISKVNEQAKIDFPGLDLVVPKPDMEGWDGGSVTDLHVPVVRKQNAFQVIGVYNVLIGETCTIIRKPWREKLY